MAAHLWAQSLTCWAKVVGTVVIAGPGGQENFIGPTFRSHRPKRETEDDIPNLDRGIWTVTFRRVNTQTNSFKLWVWPGCEHGTPGPESAQGQLRGTLRHSPPHRQFLIQRCSHCFTAVVLLGDLSMVTQPHLVQALHSSVG